ncbi:hypothetical protein [Myroides odoratimimus]|nr:hypothetical protein [Myroides odoratimimus]MEC4028950.1 hypothetical protein [Myroides odoratimimus]
MLTSLLAAEYNEYNEDELLLKIKRRKLIPSFTNKNKTFTK